jgi:cellulose synthase/poly-beta-1,6-N-acetylglucosamine synthase-like glycosyltransferase
LQQLYAWDPYNVTEDADLGLRISHRGWKCGMIWSHTDEESPISVWAWIKQRTRWIKGHMQTYLVHMRHPFSLYKKLGISGFMGMQFFFGAPTLIFLISPVMWLVWVLFIAGIFRFNTDVPEWFNYMVQVISYILLAGIAMQILSALAVIIKRKWWSMLPYVVVFPFYWILHSFASFRALWQLFRCPHHWEKTLHGVTKIEKTKV